MPNQDYRDILPPFLPTNPDDDVLGALLQVCQRGFDEASAESQDSKKAGYLPTAEDQDLNEYGTRFLTIGKRRGRGEEEYRRFLRGIVVAYQGRGRAQDIRAAVGSGVLIDPLPITEIDTIELTGYPESFEYDLTLTEHDWGQHPGGVVRQLAEYADPTVVSLRDIEYLGRTSTIEYGGGGAIVERTSGIAIIEYGGGEAIVETEATDRLTGEERLEGEGDLSGTPD